MNRWMGQVYLLASACTADPSRSGTETGSTPTDPGAGDPADVRFVSLADDLLAVDVYVDGEPLWSNVPRLGGTEYTSVPAGSHLVQVVAAGGALEDAVLERTIRWGSGAFASGALVGAAQSATVEWVGFADDPTPNPGPADGTRIQFVHAADERGPLDVWDPIAGFRLQQGLSYAEAPVRTFNAPGDPLPSFSVDLDRDGATDVEFPGEALAPGEWVDFYVIEDDEGLGLAAQSPDGSVSVARAASR